MAANRFIEGDTRPEAGASAQKEHHGGVAKVHLPRPRLQTAAAQVGEFAVGVAIAYAAVALAWTLSHSVWALVLAALVVVAAAVLVELRFGSKATGLVAGMLPTSLMAAGLFIALSLVVYRLN
jgi:hypothetical protein